MPRPSCPKCAEKQCKRRKREGFFQIVIAPLLGLYPWHCSSCRKIFLVKERGKSKNKKKTTFADYSNTPWQAGVHEEADDSIEEISSDGHEKAANQTAA